MDPLTLAVTLQALGTSGLPARERKAIVFGLCAQAMGQEQPARSCGLLVMAEEVRAAAARALGWRSKPSSGVVCSRLRSQGRPDLADRVRALARSRGAAAHPDVSLGEEVEEALKRGAAGTSSDAPHSSSGGSEPECEFKQGLATSPKVTVPGRLQVLEGLIAQLALRVESLEGASQGNVLDTWLADGCQQPDVVAQTGALVKAAEPAGNGLREDFEEANVQTEDKADEVKGDVDVLKLQLAFLEQKIKAAARAESCEVGVQTANYEQEAEDELLKLKAAHAAEVSGWRAHLTEAQKGIENLAESYSKLAARNRVLEGKLRELRAGPKAKVGGETETSPTRASFGGRPSSSVLAPMGTPTLPPAEALAAKQGHPLPTLPLDEAPTVKQGHYQEGAT